MTVKRTSVVRTVTACTTDPFKDIRFGLGGGGAQWTIDTKGRALLSVPDCVTPMARKPRELRVRESRGAISHS